MRLLVFPSSVGGIGSPVSGVVRTAQSTKQTVLVKMRPGVTMDAELRQRLQPEVKAIRPMSAAVKHHVMSQT